MKRDFVVVVVDSGFVMKLIVQVFRYYLFFSLAHLAFIIIPLRVVKVSKLECTFCMRWKRSSGKLSQYSAIVDT